MNIFLGLNLHLELRSKPRRCKVGLQLDGRCRCPFGTQNLSCYNREGYKERQGREKGELQG